LQYRVARTELRLLRRKLQIVLVNKRLLYLLGAMANNHHNIVGCQRARTI
jgi:hypothetical protein